MCWDCIDGKTDGVIWPAPVKRVQAKRKNCVRPKGVCPGLPPIEISEQKILRQGNTYNILTMKKTAGSRYLQAFPAVFSLLGVQDRIRLRCKNVRNSAGPGENGSSETLLILNVNEDLHGGLPVGVDVLIGLFVGTEGEDLAH